MGWRRGRRRRSGRSIEAEPVEVCFVLFTSLHAVATFLFRSFLLHTFPFVVHPTDQSTRRVWNPSPGPVPTTCS